MIHVKRARVLPHPDLLERAKSASHQLFLRYEAKEFQDQRIAFRSDIWKKFKPAAVELFNGKCAYCESPAETMHAAEVDHFRPKSQATSLNNDTAVDHYFWLAYEWQNIYLTCIDCNWLKRTNFPVLGQRDPIGTPWGDLKEVALLLDPCRDKPEEFLAFRSDGYVRPRELSAKVAAFYGSLHPGAITIELLSLNRVTLVEQRRRLAVTLLPLIMAKPASRAGKKARDEQIEYAISDRAPYAAMAREIVRSHSTAAEEIVIVRARPQPSVKAGPEAATQILAYEPMSILKLRIQNFRAIEDLTLSFPKSWKVLLGENATGKSTILQAVAWALMGKEFVARRYAIGRKWLTVKDGRQRKEGSIRIEFDRGDPIQIDFNRTTIHFTSGGATVPTFLRAYGTVRLPASRGRRSVPAVQSVRNLFDPHFPLTNALRWLASLLEGERKPAILAIRDMLLLDPATPVDFRRGRFSLALHGERFTTDQLSAGYQDVFNLVADIISGFPIRFSDMQEAFGIVLLDELGAHLHPRWKMQIVASLKQCFPKVQFLVTTHDPLCLRGLEEDEVAVMTRDSEGVAARVHFDRPPRDMRVDQLLTSSYFGLQSTVDPALDADLREYYRLLLKERRTPDEERRRQSLKLKLDTVSAHGITRRDQELCRILDEYLVKALRDPQLASEGPDEETKRQVWDRWKQLQEGRA